MPRKLFTKDNQPSPEKKSRKGKPNRTTEEMRQVIQHVIDNNLDNLADDLARMSPATRWGIIAKLNGYVLPTLSKNDNNNLNSGDLTIKVEYIDTPQNKTDDDSNRVL